MFQIKLSNAQYLNLYSALSVAVNATKKEAQDLKEEALDLKDLGLLTAAYEVTDEVLTYQHLQAYLQHNKEVI